MEFKDFFEKVKATEAATEFTPCEVEYIRVNVDETPNEYAESNSPMSVNINGEDVCARGIAWPSLLARAKISGTSLSKLNPEDLSMVVNTCMKVNKDIGLAVMVGDKLSAVLSDGYRILSVTEIYRMANEEFSKYGEFLDGFVDDTGFGARWKLKGEIGNAYGDNLTPVIELYTSNTGHSAVTLVPKLVRGSRFEFICGSSMSVEHKGKSSLQDVKDLVSMAYALARKAVNQMDALKNIPVRHPVETFLNTAKKIGVPKKLAMMALTDFTDMIYGNENDVCAYDVYMGLVETVFYAQQAGKDKRFCDNLQEIVARALTISWTDSDHNKIEWVVKSLPAA